MIIKLIKRSIILTLAAVICLSATGCGSSKEETTSPSGGSQYPTVDYMAMDIESYITLGQYKGLDIEITPKPVITEQTVADKIAADLIYSGYTKTVTDRAVTKNDTVKISYKGLLDGVAFEGGTGDKDNFTVYDGGGFIDGFADGIIGAMPGVETDVHVTFPEKYHAPELAGKAVIFKVTVHHIYEAQELTDEIANKITKGDHKTAKSMTDYYRNRLNEENDNDYKMLRADLTWSRIFNGITVKKLPEDVINDLYEHDLKNAQFYADAYKITLDELLASDGYTRESLRKEIENNVLTNMIIYHIIKVEGITVTDEDYKGFIEDSDMSEEEWLSKYSKAEMMDMFVYTKAFYAAADWQNFTEKAVSGE